MFIADRRISKAGLEGFRTMRGLLEARGMSQSEAEEWAALAVNGFKSACDRGDTIQNAADYFFSAAMAAEYFEMWRFAKEGEPVCCAP